jgi:hypothetical protein
MPGRQARGRGWLVSYTCYRPRRRYVDFSDDPLSFSLRLVVRVYTAAAWPLADPDIEALSSFGSGDCFGPWRAQSEGW